VVPEHHHHHPLADRQAPRAAKGLNMLGQQTVKIPLLGAIVSVRGSVVDIRFDEHLPPIYSVLRAGDEGRIVIEVLAQLDARHVRGIALTPTQGLARGMRVEDTGGPLKAPVGKEILSRMFDVFGNVIDRDA
jgi:F-type H+/Na+-transporting ATPase subunit beta